MKIRVSADSTCDLSPALVQEYHIAIIPLIVNKDGESFRDGVTITPAEIFAHVAAGGDLCSTSAVSIGEYQERFTALRKDCDVLIHINIGSGFSSCYQNACIAAEEVGGVYVIDSRSLSTGQGQIVLEACQLAEAGVEPEEIVRRLVDLTGRVDISFLLDRLDYMVKGGRCSLVKALGANLLNLKPCIEVVDNKMIVGKKYRGKYAKCMENYVRDRLGDAKDLRKERILITHTPVDDEILTTVRSTVAECQRFENTYETEAGCTVSCHCGEGCLGIIYIHEA